MPTHKLLVDLSVGGTLTVGADDTGHDVKFFGATSGASWKYGGSGGDGVLLTHPTGATGLEIYTISGAVPTVPQLKIGRASSQYWGVYTNDRDANVIHRQDETSGIMNTNFQQWDSNTSDTTGKWQWQHGDGNGSSLQNVMVLDQGGNLSGLTTVTASGELEGGSLDINGNAQIDGTLTVGIDDTGYDVKFYGATSSRFLHWDESQDYLLFRDNVKGVFGNGADLKIYHDSSHSYIENGTGSIYIMARATDADISFQSDDGSGGDAEYLRIDGGVGYTIASKAIRALDSVNLQLGTSADLTLQHNGTDSQITNYTGHLQFTNTADDKDITFATDDGSGGDTVYFTIDGGAERNIFSKAVSLTDSVKLMIGSSNDLQIFHDGTNTLVENYVGNFTFEQRTDDGDIIFKCDNGSGGITPYITLDGSAGYTTVQKQIRLEDNVEFRLGDSGDAYAVHDGSNFFLVNDTGDLTIKNSADDKDIIFQCDDHSGGTSTYFFLDGSTTSELTTKFPDNSMAAFGTGSDLRLWHDGSTSYINNYTGTLKFYQHVDDGDMIFYCDDGSGGATAYLTLDGSSAKVLVSRPAIFYDTIEMASYIYHNGDTNSYFGFSAADTFNLHVGGAEVLRVNGGSTTDEAAVSILCGGGTNVENIALLLKGDTNGEALKLKIQNPNDSGTLTGAGILSYEPDADTFNIGQSTTHANMAISIDNSENVTFGGDVTVEPSSGGNGQLNVTRTSGATTFIQSQSATGVLGTSSNHKLDIKTNSSTRLSIANSGDATFNHNVIVTGNITANGNIIGDDSTNITNIASIGADTYSADADSTTRIGMSATSMDFLVEDEDVFNCSSTTLTVDAKLVAKKRVLAKTSNTDANADGDIVYFGGTTSMDAGKIYYFNSSGAWALADADAESTAKGMLGVALGSASDTNGVLIRGMVTLDTDPGTIGDTVFLSTTAGVATATAPSGSGDIVRVIGYCLDSTNGQIYFNPDGAFVEVA